MRKLQFWGWLIFLLLFVASPVSADTPQPTTDPLLMTPDFTGLNVPLANYFWDPEGVLGQYNMAYIIGNSLLLCSVALVRLSTWFLNLGYMPSQWLTPVQQIADAIQQGQLIHHIWPILPVIAAAVLFKDFFKHQYQRAVQRAILFGLTLLALIAFQGLGTAKYLSLTTQTIDALSYGVSGWVLGAAKSDTNETGDKVFEQRNQDIDKEIWTRLVQNPWEMGEIGAPGSKIDEKDIPEVQNQISNGEGGISGFILKTLGLPSNWDKTITKDTPWRDVILRFPEGSGARNGLAGILNSDDHPGSKTAFNPYYRALIGLIMALSAAGVSAYNGVMGFFLLGAHVLFIVAITAGIVVLPCCLIPWSYSEKMLQWWMKTVTGSIFIKIALSAYVGATFLVIEIFRPAATAQSTGNSLLYMLLYPVWFVAALWILFRIQKRWRPLQRMTGVNFPGSHRFFPANHRKGNQSNFDESGDERGDHSSTWGNQTSAPRVNPERSPDPQPVQLNETEPSSQPEERTTGATEPEAAANRNQAAAPRTNPERERNTATTMPGHEESDHRESIMDTTVAAINPSQAGASRTRENEQHATEDTRNERNQPHGKKEKFADQLDRESGTRPASSDPEQAFSQNAYNAPQPQEEMVSSTSTDEWESPNRRESESEGEEEGNSRVGLESPYIIHDYRLNQPSELTEEPMDHPTSKDSVKRKPVEEKTDQESAQRVGDPDQRESSRETKPEVSDKREPKNEELKEQDENPGPPSPRRNKPSLDAPPAQEIHTNEQNPELNRTQQVLEKTDGTPRIPRRKERLGLQEQPNLDEKASAAVEKEPRKKSRRKIKLPADVEASAAKIKSDQPQL